MTMSDAEHLAIGEVLSLLKETFPDVTISKIRFLESQGLINPERTPSGYRKFSMSDIEVLHWVLTMQRDHFLPLKVIKAKLSASGGVPIFEAPPVAVVSAGAQPSLFEPTSTDPPVADPPVTDVEHDLTDAVPGHLIGSMSETIIVEFTPVADETDVAALSESAVPKSPAHDVLKQGTVAGEPDPGAWLAALQESPDGVQVADTRRPRAVPDRPTESIADIVPQFDDSRYTAAELATQGGVSEELIEQLAMFGLLAASTLGGETTYNAAALDVVQGAKGFLERGIEPRHLRGFKLAAEREATLFEQLLIPLLRQRNPQARADAMEELGRLTAMGEALRRSLLHQALHSHLSPR